MLAAKCRKRPCDGSSIADDAVSSGATHRNCHFLTDLADAREACDDRSLEVPHSSQNPTVRRQRVAGTVAAKFTASF
jgi:hypothetical protein